MQRPRLQHISLGLLLRAVPDLGQTGVIENLHGLKVATVLGFPGLLVLLGQRRPVLPAQRGIQRVEVEAHGFAVTLCV
ncbi:hypothetical protein D3C77_521640 [compost metagenome]